MFTTTRELLSKYITPKLVRELEADMIAARANGGRLPSADDKAEADSAASEEAPSEATPKDVTDPTAENPLPKDGEPAS